MGLQKSNLSARVFLSIAKGFIRMARRDANGNVIKDAEGKSTFDSFDSLKGIITAVGTHDTTVNGQPCTFLDITVFDGGENKNYVVSVDKNSNVAEALIMALASAPGFAGKEAEIKVWPRKSVDANGKETIFTNTSIHLGGVKLGWAVAPEDRPRVTLIEGVGYDRRERRAFVDEYLKKIQDVLASEATASGAAEMPAGLTEEPEAEAALDDLPM